MASETTTAAISQQHFQSNSYQPIRILPLHRGCAEVRYVADSLNTLLAIGFHHQLILKGWARCCSEGVSFFAHVVPVVLALFFPLTVSIFRWRVAASRSENDPFRPCHHRREPEEHTYELFGPPSTP